MDDLIRKSACEIVALLKAGEISTDDTLDALAARMDRVETDINALPIRCFDRAREQARAGNLTETMLAGIPVAIKDLTAVSGVRYTEGSMLYKDRVATASNRMVERLEENGGVIYAKSNTPEFGTGGNTFNDVFGATCNPYDTSRSAGGSSGGAAAALASGTAWLAQGSDLGGSLRTPASFCGVTSLRPSPGVVTSDPGLDPFDVYSQKGPMARDVADLALFADALAGPSDLAGFSKRKHAQKFRRAAANPRKPLRIAFSVDLGVTHVEAAVRNVFEQAVARLQADGIDLESAHPELGDMWSAFDVSRALDYALSYADGLDDARETFKPEVIWNIEHGLSLSVDDIRQGQAARGKVFNNAANFMQDFDLLICPAAVVEPYPVEERYPGYSEGLAYSEYYRWLAICCAITTTTLPVVTIPCGKTDSGLPVGIQLVGKPHGDAELFSLASYLETLFDWDPLQRISG